MSEKEYAGAMVNVDEQGYLTDFSQWNRDIGVGIAAEEDVNMTNRHWEVINFIQDQFKKDSPLSIRKIGKSGVVDIKEFYKLFPDGPLKKASRIAGIPKPKSCI